MLLAATPEGGGQNSANVLGSGHRELAGLPTGKEWEVHSAALLEAACSPSSCRGRAEPMMLSQHHYGKELSTDRFYSSWFAAIQ